MVVKLSPEPTLSWKGKLLGKGSLEQTFIDLNDLGFCGPSFTSLRGGIHERLDRAIGNNVWLTAFPHSLVTHLPRIKSDHRPLLLILRLEANLPKGRPVQICSWMDSDLLRQLEIEVREDLKRELEPDVHRWIHQSRFKLCNCSRSYARYLGTCSILVAELWAIFDGLTLILERGNDRVLINTDSIETALAIQDHYSRDSKSTLIRQIHQFLTKAHCNTPNPAQTLWSDLVMSHDRVFENRVVVLKPVPLNSLS
ncbi:hypothetical protein Godav_001624 [Gossypium davidsonii]|uniref:RNase H type-1 domain-containing protein n=1 Tax=Gossypium davidsonii TaxID=34287 RepID=A0A7J8T3N6_GOSDV|nr:hypothetical protein [Gossypium davidsonii]